MASPTEYEAPTSITRDLYAIMFEGWSPSELHALDPHLDMTRPTQDPICIAGKTRLLLRPSMCMVAFDLLHAYWDPHTMAPVAERGRALASPATQLIVHDIPCPVGHPKHNSFSGRNGGAAIGGRLVDPLQQLFAGSCDSTVSMSTSAPPPLGTMPKSMQDDSWFRIVSDCGHGRRRYVVERAAGHVLSLLQALRYSFPHLMVPFITEVTTSTLAVVMDFLSYHGEALSTYVPLHYFLFETNLKAFVVACGPLSDVIRQRVAQEDSCFALAKKPQRSSWFGFGSSASSAIASTLSDAAGASGDWGTHRQRSMSLKEELDYAERDERVGKHLPPKFRAKFAESLSRYESLGDALENARLLERCIAEEGQALDRLAEAFTEIQASLTDDEVAGWRGENIFQSTPQSDGKTTTNVANAATTAGDATLACTSNAAMETSMTLTETNKILKSFFTVCSVLQGQVAIPMASGLRGAVVEVEVYAMTRRQFMRSMIETAKFIQDKEPLILGREDIRDSPAASNPAIMAQIKDIYAKRRGNLRNQKVSMPDELQRVDRLSQAALARVCTIVASLFHHIADAYDARHYTGLYQHRSHHASTSQGSDGATASPPGSPLRSYDGQHPVAVLLESVPTPQRPISGE